MEQNDDLNVQRVSDLTTAETLEQEVNQQVTLQEVQDQQPQMPLRVYDDFFDPETYAQLLDFTDGCGMFFGAKSSAKRDPYGHWVTIFSGDGKPTGPDTSQDLPHQIYTAWKSVRDVLENKSLVTSYMNGHTYGIEGYFHVDTDEENCDTAIVYLVRDNWDPDWGGETIFIDDYGEIMASVMPKANRLVVFQSTIRHCARGVTRKYNGLRKTLMFKTQRNFQ